MWSVILRLNLTNTFHGSVPLLDWAKNASFFTQQIDATFSREVLVLWSAVVLTTESRSLAKSK
jgi:hypothetical protein